MIPHRLGLLIVVATLLGAIAGSRCAVADEELIRNGGMEAPGAGVPAGWSSNSYGDLHAMVSIDTLDRHSGASSLLIACRDYVRGAAQAVQRGLSLVKDEPYRVRLWMKAKTPLRVMVVLRENRAPFFPYIHDEFHVTTDWRPYVVTGRAPVSSTDVGLYIALQSNGEIHVDDVSVTRGEPGDLGPRYTVVQAPRNLIYNPSFEVGAAGWTPSRQISFSREARDGRWSAVVREQPLESRPIAIIPFQQYTASAWVRAEQGTANLRIEIAEWADIGHDVPTARYSVSRDVLARQTWTRVDLTNWIAPRQSESVVVRFSADGPVDVDAVQFQLGRLTDYLDRDRADVGLIVDPAWRALGASVPIAVRIDSRRRRPCDVEIEVEDVWGQIVGRTLLSVRQGKDESRWEFRPRTTGAFRIVARVAGSDAHDEASVPVLPPVGRQYSLESPFGIHALPVNGSPSLRAAEAIGARWIRLHDFGDYCHWYQVEPAPGIEVWHDREIDELAAAGFTIMANLGHPPTWASSPRGHATADRAWGNSPPRDIAEWSDYVRKTVQHYSSRIKMWEIWNEPYNKDFFDGTPEEYVALLRAAYGVIKSVDPDAMVIGGCFTPARDEWTNRVLAAGALPSMDAMSFHYYWGPRDVEGGASSAMSRAVAHYTNLMLHHGRVLPLFLTEGGVRSMPLESDLPEHDAVPVASDAVFALVAGIAELLSTGVSRIGYYYAGPTDARAHWYSTVTTGAYGLFDYRSALKPTAVAYAVVEHALRNRHPAGFLRVDDVVFYMFDGTEGVVALGWASENPREPPLDRPCFDAMGAPSACRLERNRPVIVNGGTMPPGEFGDELSRALRSGRKSLE